VFDNAGLTLATTGSDVTIGSSPWSLTFKTDTAGSYSKYVRVKSQGDVFSSTEYQIKVCGAETISVTTNPIEFGLVQGGTAG
jgi:hypothetical protein